MKTLLIKSHSFLKERQNNLLCLLLLGFLAGGGGFVAITKKEKVWGKCSSTVIKLNDLYKSYHTTFLTKLAEHI